MAEFCIKCWNEINGINDSEDMYFMSKSLDLCEGCGEWKSVIIKPKAKFFKFSLKTLKKKRNP